MNKSVAYSIKTMVDAYLEAALFSTTGDDDQPLDKKHSLKSFTKEAVEKATFDCQRFLLAIEMPARRTFGEYAALDYSRLGHDFWLTRNRHGAGFWDGDWPEPFAAEATKISHSFGEVDILVYRKRLQFSR